MGDRNEAIYQALARSAEKSKATRKQKRDKNAKTRPWKVLAQEWFEGIWATYGKEVKPESWGKPEKALARKLLREEVDLDKAIKMVRRFIHWWYGRNEGLPSFRYFWKMRGAVRGWVEGTVQTSKEQRHREREYDDSPDDLPDIGWGNVLD